LKLAYGGIILSMKIFLETSSIIGFLNSEPDCQAIDKILTLAKAGQIEIFVSDFAWEEQKGPLDEMGSSKKKRLESLANHAAKVARIGEWVLGVDVLAHDNSAEIESTLSTASQPDREQFLSHAALGSDFFVTKDKDFLKESVLSKFAKQYGFKVGTPEECLTFIEKRGEG
jgi:predicted nucleic acid-binding protein